MLHVAEGIRGVHILGVFNSRESLEQLFKSFQINPQSKYVVMEVGMQEETVEDVLAGLGVRGTMAGAGYLRDAVNIAMANPEMVERVTKLMYPEIARLRGTTASRVERAIRVAIEKSWMLGSRAYKKQVFGSSADDGCGRPTNSEYIVMVADYLKK